MLATPGHRGEESAWRAKGLDLLATLGLLATRDCSPPGSARHPSRVPGIPKGIEGTLM